MLRDGEGVLSLEVGSEPAVAAVGLPASVTMSLSKADGVLRGDRFGLRERSCLRPSRACGPYAGRSPRFLRSVRRSPGFWLSTLQTTSRAFAGDSTLSSW